jgi:arylsulfatase A-like enzyme
MVNATRYPRSSLGEPYHALASSQLLGVSPAILASVALSSAIACTIAFALLRTLPWNRGGKMAAGATVLAAVVIVGWKQLQAEDNPNQSPHVVLLGIDSLRPDQVTPESAPHVYNFMSGAVQMADTVTPLARTFPAWTSILSGRHPHTTGATMNLLPREAIKLGLTLPELLRQHGYRSYYAIDETRFSNIDASYGFDKTATPSIGGSDFVIAWFGDTPLSNLVVNTPLGALLFPHLHANRAAHVIYDPDSFVERVDRSFDFAQPTFLAVHLTLPHWPYTWAASVATTTDESNSEALYVESVRRADQQFGDLLARLEARGVLENALVVVLSDHGEALGHAEDFLAEALPDGHEERNRFQKWGHGTSVFSPAQYRVVLGFRAFGRAATLVRQPARVDAPASLLDIAPTLLELLDIERNEAFDGLSLAGLLTGVPGAEGPGADRIRFTETEYNPLGFSPLQVENDKLALAAKVYRLDPDSDRILVRTEYMKEIMANRQYAALWGRNLLATAIPGERGYQFLVIPDLEKGSTGNAVAGPRLQQALQDRFGIRFAPEMSATDTGE